MNCMYSSARDLNVSLLVHATFQPLTQKTTETEESVLLVSIKMLKVTLGITTRNSVISMGNFRLQYTDTKIMGILLS